MIYLFSDSVNMLESQPVIPSEIILEHEVTKELNGFNSVYIEYVAGEVDVSEAKYVVFMDSNNAFQMYKILSKGTKGTVSYIEGVHKFLDDLKASDFFIEFEKTDVEPKVMLENALSSTQWVLDTSDTFPSGNISLEEVSPLEVLEEVLKKFPIEIDYWIEFDDNSIVSQRYALRERLGVRKNKFYEYGSNVLNIEVEHNTSEIYTAAIGLGSTINNEDNLPQEKEVRVDFSNVVWSKSNGNPLDKPKGYNVLIDDQATIKHGYFENGKYKPRITYVVFDEIDDPNELIKETHKWLVFQTLPKAVYRVEVFDGDNVNLGDEVAVRYADIGVSKWTKVSMTKENLIAGKKDIYFGDVGYFNSNSTKEKLEGEIDTLKKGYKKYSQRIYEMKLAFDKEFVDRVNAIENEYQLRLDLVTNQIQADQERIENEMSQMKLEQQQRVSEIYEDIGGINQTVSDVANKADYLDGVYTDLSTQTGEVSSTVANIIDGKAPAGSVLRQTTDSVLGRVWEQDIDNLSFENRNLLRNTDFTVEKNVSNLRETVSGNVNISQSKPPDYDKTFALSQATLVTGNNIGFQTRNDRFKVEEGHQYTLSLIYIVPSTVDENMTYTYLMNPLTNAEKPNQKLAITSKTKIGTAFTSFNVFKATFTFTANWSEESAWLLIGSNVISNGNAWVRISEPKLEKGSKATPYSQAPEDFLKHTDLVLKSDGFLIGTFEMGGDKIAQAIVGKAGAIDLIADNVNLSNNLNVANQIKSLSLETVYANISELRTRMLVADVITANMVKFDTALIEKFTSSTAFINSLTAKSAFISNVKAIDIDFNRATATGGSGSATLSITGDRILQSGTFNRIWKGVSYDYNVSTIMREGYIKFADFSREREISMSAFGISTFVDGSGNQDGYAGSSGTISWWDKTYGNADGITISSEVGVPALKSFRNRVVLDAQSTVDIYSQSNAIHLNPNVTNFAGVNRFAFTVGDSSTYGRVGYQMFGAGADGIEFGSGLRFHKARNQPRISVVDMNFATSSATVIEAGIGEFERINTRYNTLILGVSNIGEVRIQQKGTSTYKDLRIDALHTQNGDAFKNHSGTDVFFGVGGGTFVVTNNNGYNGGNITYRDIHFQNWKAHSHERSKYDIENWNDSVLDVFRRELQLKKYKLKSEIDLENQFLHRGIVIRSDSTKDEFPAEWRNGDGFNGNEVIWWTVKGVQELAHENDTLKDKINDLENKINKIMEMIA